MYTWRIDNSGGWAISNIVATVLIIVACPRVAALASAALDRNAISEVNKSQMSWSKANAENRTAVVRCKTAHGTRGNFRATEE